MVSIIKTVAFQGIDALPVDVQVQLSSGLPAFTIVGLPDKAVSEARERVRAALTALGLSLPVQRITINLSPADLPKEGSHYDLPIALGLLVAMDILPGEELEQTIVMGELGLDGSIRRVSGVLPAAVTALTLKASIVCPADCGPEAAWAGEELPILAPDSLIALLNHFRGHFSLNRPEPIAMQPKEVLHDFKDVKGQETAKRVLELAAAGGHTVLMTGPPGSGKSMLASRLPSILPSLRAPEILEVSMIASIAGELGEEGITNRRPYRDPHHSASMPALIGGGQRAQPGEISLSHCGILFLDELPEFNRVALEGLRQPLETGQVMIARAQARVTYPAQFQLIAAMNPCRCGYLDDPSRACSRAPKCALDYQKKISGPLLDRIDLYIDVSELSAQELLNPGEAERSSTIAKRVAICRDRQRERFKRLNAPHRMNAEANGEILELIAPLDAACHSLLKTAIQDFKFSARAYHRVLKVARTIADLAFSEAIKEHHIAEALSYRKLTY
ncbi:YifB family Mg chelatase-like AAA ATPase [Temperatibacter marinus]|uniref:YifB family Mg chelatase-like AAA ATPase n=1 Tax=Temperatibacter marinus TaxID=1456591 RepID=A0AA52EF94_9PROT|nr:YifB family Mg chelatase-like AAA ATPase [Temperatibacter marinus]WND03706.1 YifB family Mg chelatase-like AAA ATPase [Temperatibacter marinus]